MRAVACGTGALQIDRRRLLLRLVRGSRYRAGFSRSSGPAPCDGWRARPHGTPAPVQVDGSLPADQPFVEHPCDMDRSKLAPARGPRHRRPRRPARPAVQAAGQGSSSVWKARRCALCQRLAARVGQQTIERAAGVAGYENRSTPRRPVAPTAAGGYGASRRSRSSRTCSSECATGMTMALAVDTAAQPDLGSAHGFNIASPTRAALLRC